FGASSGLSTKAEVRHTYNKLLIRKIKRRYDQQFDNATPLRNCRSRLIVAFVAMNMCMPAKISFRQVGGCKRKAVRFEPDLQRYEKERVSASPPQRLRDYSVRPDRLDFLRVHQKAPHYTGRGCNSGFGRRRGDGDADQVEASLALYQFPPTKRCENL